MVKLRTDAKKKKKENVMKDPRQWIGVCQCHLRPRFLPARGGGGGMIESLFDVHDP